MATAEPRRLEADRAYRQRIRDLQRQTVLAVADQFRTISADDISGTLRPAVDGMANVVSLGQAAAQAATSEFYGYVAELDQGAFTIAPPAPDVAGRTAAGGSLVDAMGSIAPAIFQALSGGTPPAQAMQFGLHRASQIAATETLAAAHREAEHQGREGKGFGYLVSGAGARSCPICRGRQDGKVHSWSKPFRPLHPGCSCVAVPASSARDSRVPAPGEVVDELNADEVRMLAEHQPPPNVSLEENLRRRFPDMTDEQIATEAQRVRLSADRLLGEYGPLEPRVTSDIGEVARIGNGETAGLEFRLKEPGSLARKIAEDMAEKGYTTQQATDGINDAVRYTILRGDDDYVQGAIDTVAELRARGYTFLKAPKNFWGQDGYQGLHTLWRSPGGVRLELQFHTFRSIEVKAISHQIIDLGRGTLDAATLTRYRLVTLRLWAENLRTHPPGADALQALIEAAGGWG